MYNITENSNYNITKDDTNYNITNEYNIIEINREKLKTLEEKIPVILEEYNKLYVLNNLYPNYEDIQNQFNNIQNELNQINRQLYDMNNTIEKEIINLNKVLNKLNENIFREKKINSEYKNNLHNINFHNNASVEMINDYKHIYNEKYTRNIALLLCILFSLFIVNKIFPSIKTNIVNAIPNTTTIIPNKTQNIIPNAVKNIVPNINNFNKENKTQK